MKLPGERGFALLVVLWSLVLISLITTRILSTAHTAMLLADNSTAVAQAQARADGAINEAIFQLLSSNGSDCGLPGGRPRVITNSQETLALRIRLLDDKINPNLASPALLAGLFQASGASSAQAIQLANAAVQWRDLADSQQAAEAKLAKYRQAGLSYGPPGHHFGDLTELAYVIGMTPALLARAMPHMSLVQTGDPNPAHADSTVRAALADSGQADSSNVNSGSACLVSIEAVAKGPGGITTRRNATINIDSALPRMPFQYLSLTSGN